MRALRVGLLLAAVAIASALFAGSSGALGNDDLAILGNKRTIVLADMAARHAKAAPGVPSQFECTAVSGGANTKLDCGSSLPNNEPHIAVDPANPQHMSASSNDYDSCCDEFYTTFNGGATWATGDMSTEPGFPTGSDPVTAFDRKHGVALHSSLNFFFNADGSQACNGDVVVSPPTDGGLNWAPPVVVSHGVGCDLDPTQVFNDKEWITTDNNPKSKFYGRTYVTWTAFVSHNGVFASSPIFEAHSSDGGQTWSQAQEISGANPALCTFQTPAEQQENGHNNGRHGGPGACNNDQFSSPTVGPDGTDGLLRVPEQLGHGAHLARRVRRRPVPGRQVEEWRRGLVEPEFRG